MRVVLLSDTHARHRMVGVPEGDVLIHAGDLTNAGHAADLVDVNRWLGDLPHRHKIAIAGNHDIPLERDPETHEPLLTNCIYLRDSGITLDGVRFYGSPWQPEFMDWAFNLSRGAELREKWDLIPPEVDILITHGPPAGHGDMTTRGEAVGCADLMEAVRRVRPRLHVFGHIHEGASVTEEGGTTFVNASCVNVRCRPVNPPIVFDTETGVVLR